MVIIIITRKSAILISFHSILIHRLQITDHGTNRPDSKQQQQQINNNHRISYSVLYPLPPTSTRKQSHDCKMFEKSTTQHPQKHLNWTQPWNQIAKWNNNKSHDDKLEWNEQDVVVGGGGWGGGVEQEVQ